MIDETELLKRETKSLSKEKLELETTVDDLKRTLKLTEKESQVIISFYYIVNKRWFLKKVHPTESSLVCSGKTSFPKK